MSLQLHRVPSSESTLQKYEMEAAAKVFFTSANFAVAGASQDTTKFGYKLLAWYVSRSLPVTPVTPSRSSIQVASKDYDAAPSPKDLYNPSQTSLSIVTPPAVTLKVLKDAKEAGIAAVWLQPGSFDDEGMTFAKQAFEGAAVGGMDGRGGEGWCVLVDGDWARKASGKL